LRGALEFTALCIAFKSWTEEKHKEGGGKERDGSVTKRKFDRAGNPPHKKRMGVVLDDANEADSRDKNNKAAETQFQKRKKWEDKVWGVSAR